MAVLEWTRIMMGLLRTTNAALKRKGREDGELLQVGQRCPVGDNLNHRVGWGCRYMCIYFVRYITHCLV